MHWDYLKRWTNFRRQLSKRHVTPKINFHKNKETRQNSPETALVWFFVISLTSWHSNKACKHCSTQKPIYYFLNVNFFVFSFLWTFKKYCHFINFFTLYDVCIAFWLCFSPFESIAAAYVHLATSSVTMTCWYVYTAKLEIHTQLK